MNKHIHIHLNRAPAKDATTAELREKGRTLRSAGKFKEAAQAYREAIAAYPESQKNGALGKADIASLEKFMRQCEASASSHDATADADPETQKVKVTFWPRGSTQTMNIDVPKGTGVNEAIALAKKQIPAGSTFVSVSF